MKNYVYIICAFIMCAILFVGCSDAKKEYLVVVPDGAPSLSILNLLDEDFKIDGEKTSYKVVDAKSLSGYVAKPQADLAILPINLASKIINDNYQLLSIMTFGNLYLVGISGESFDDCVGETLNVINLNNVPGLITKLALNQLNLKYTMGNQANDNIKLVGTTPSALIGGFGSGQVKYAVVAEPAVSMLKTKVANLKVIADLQTILGGYPQSALVVKKNVFSANAINNLIAKLKDNSNFLTQNLSRACDILQPHLQKGLVSVLKQPLLSMDLIERCNVGFKLACNEKANINSFIAKMCEIDKNSAKAFIDGAFYEVK